MRRSSQLKAIESLSLIEARLEWIQKFLSRQEQNGLQKLSQFALLSKSLVFSSAAQLTADAFDKSKVLIEKPQVAFEPENEDISNCLLALQQSSEEIKKLHKKTRWQMERANQLGTKIANAYIQIDGLKSAVAVTIAGWSYLDRLDEDGLLMQEGERSEKNEVRGYV